ncbi:MAG: pantoate--beta-alanine ligase [Rhodothermales bacterium]|jgi:pantoate--beta-alanine ligase
MDIIDTIPAMQAQAKRWQAAGETIALVPTMGFLHEGHSSLIRIASREADRVVVSIFVNPTQFGPNEDLDVYPRDMRRDLLTCEAHGADLVFAPSNDAVYLPDSSTWVNEEQLSLGLCGGTRPGHFRGVTTIVAKLFLAVLPDVAVFGQKDAQQSAVLQRMVRDLNFPIRLIIGPIVREPDGLAMSSRNAYLSADERQRALALNRGLRSSQTALAGGTREADTLVAALIAKIAKSGGRLDYVSCVDAETLAPISGQIERPALLAVAAFYGRTRLIDNCRLQP